MLGGRQLTEGNPEVIGIVKRVQEVLVERVDVLEAGEAIENRSQLLAESLLRVFDLACIEA